MSKEITRNNQLGQISDTIKTMCEYYGIKPNQCDIYNKQDIRVALERHLRVPEK